MTDRLLTHRREIHDPNLGPMGLEQLSGLVLPSGGLVKVRIEEGGERTFGFAIAHFLTRIPAAGVNLDKLSQDSERDWLLGILQPSGLVVESPSSSGNYVRSEAANKGNYTVVPYRA